MRVYTCVPCEPGSWRGDLCAASLGSQMHLVFDRACTPPEALELLELAAKDFGVATPVPSRAIAHGCGESGY